MPKIEATRPIEIAVGGRKTRLAPGIYTIADEDMDAWYIPGLIQTGEIKVFSEGQLNPSEKPAGKLMYDVGKITLGEGGKPSPQGPKQPPVNPDVGSQSTNDTKSDPVSKSPVKTKLKRS